MPGKLLGCGEHEVYITGPGGEDILATVKWSSLSYNRRLDDISDARVVMGYGQSDQCLRMLSDLKPFLHEFAIYRDGTHVWSGPITEPTFTYHDASIQARDVLQWLERRLLTQTHGFVDTELSTIAAAFIADALDPDPSPNIGVEVGVSGVTGTRSVLPTQYRRAADEIRELARTGLDLTVVGRIIKIFGTEVPSPILARLTDDIFEIDTVRLAGLQMANDVRVIGSGTSGVSLGPVGVAGGADIPLIQQVYSEPSILDVASANHAAETRWDLLHEAPTYISGRLLEQAPLNINDIIPGSRVAVEQQVGPRRIIGTFRIQTADVTTDVRDDGVTENVRVQLQPLGSVES